MCGLAAILAYGAEAPPPDRAELLAVRDAMVPRGPDGAGLWLDGRVGLAHRRLSIIEITEAGAQPMATSDGRLRVTFNGEIYNYRALRAELEAQGVAFASHSDTEVLLHLYRRDGIDMLRSLRGMFAFALWDEERRGMLLARDPFGIKPLYIADDGRTLRAASQVKALLAGGGIDTCPSPAGHAGFFLWGHVPEPFTLYRGVEALPAGGWLWVEEGGARRSGRHFDLREEALAAQPADIDLGAALRDSVAHHLIADVPVGVFLSAGIDSASLASLAVEVGGGPVETVTLGFDRLKGTHADEVPLAEDLARRLGTHQRTQWVGEADFAEARERIFADMDQPSVDGVNTWFVARAARQAGLKVALSGLGGDEMFGGYDTFRQLPRMERLLRPMRLLPGLGAGLRFLAAPWIGRFASPKLAGLLELGPRLSDAYLLKRGLFMPWELKGVLDPDMAAAGLEGLATRSRLAEAVAGLEGDMRTGVLEMSFYMRNQLLRDADWAGMAHSLEIRTPFVDVGLLRACLPALVGPHRPAKRDVARSARLPDSIISRPKTGFTVPVSQWLGLGGPSSRLWAGLVHGRFTAGDVR
ncbi:asparagine synthase (glutamine-hydrolyzing) [Magnetospirillum sp. ME-1]|uniref:asparagine synthase (glutamine-hydrolyzing) n=1 Tax=Magnetospirillum sp. ME-1 TaxID=1639348 RepID=UPI000A17A811|nr:asparagine synthase (glutamine-hydrolyzing) [Magnetospirillum sp. ME-1]ARJ66562.1 asparagine synthase (glutamine-hydrolyzing) [Magnetospirillum sp. ME-1]